MAIFVRVFSISILEMGLSVSMDIALIFSGLWRPFGKLAVERWMEIAKR